MVAQRVYNQGQQPHDYGAQARVRILPSLFVTSRLKKNWTVCVDSIRVIQPFKDGPHAVRDTKFPGFEFPCHDFSLWSVSLCFSYSATFSFSPILLEMIPYCVATLIFAEIVVNRRQKVRISSCELDWLSFFHFHAVFSSSSQRRRRHTIGVAPVASAGVSAGQEGVEAAGLRAPREYDR